MPIVQVRARWDYGVGGPGYNIWHREAPTFPLDNAWETATVAALTRFYTALVPALVTGTTITIERDAIRLDTREYVDLGAEVIVTVPGGEPNKAPLATAIVIGWRTASATRSGRGRTFVGPVGQRAVQSDGTPTATALTACNAAAEAILDPEFDPVGDGSFGVYSRTTGQFRPFTGHRVRDTFAVLRSRRD